MVVKKVALVTGGNRGIGFEVCRGLAQKDYSVVLCSRNKDSGEKAAADLRKQGLLVESQALDVISEGDVYRVGKWVIEKFGRLDVLVNNAGVNLEPFRQSTNDNGEDSSILNVKIETIRQTLETNTYGAIRMIQEFVPLMRKNGYGRIVNISSGMGQLSEMNGGWAGYRLSKVALNGVTRIVSDELQGMNILVNSVCPGWVRTDMGGPEAELTTEEGAETPIWLAMLNDGEATGGFFRDMKRINW